MSRIVDAEIIESNGWRVQWHFDDGTYSNTTCGIDGGYYITDITDDYVQVEGESCGHRVKRIYKDGRYDNLQ